METLTYSELVYLFADSFVNDRASFVNYDSHPSGQKFPVGKLSQAMVTAAVCYLVDSGYIALDVRPVKKLFLFSGSDVLVKKIKNTEDGVTGIESVLLSTVNEDTKLSSAVYNLLSEDESSPWGQIIALSKVSLLKKNILKREETAKVFSVKKYLYDPKVREEYKTQQEAVAKSMAEFSKNESLFSLASAAIKSGMAARKEAGSSDD